MKPLILIAGPCVIESWEVCAKVAEVLADIQAKHGNKLHCIFKSSFDKANRSSIDSYRGIGVEAGMEMLIKVSDGYKLPITTDFHTCEQVLTWGGHVNAIQIPALLSRQTDLLASAAMVSKHLGPPVNVKKGQFMAPGDVKGIRSKLPGVEFWITERGVSFGYGRTIVDFTGFDIMRPYVDKIIVDCTHSNNGKRSDGITLARCAITAGADGIFVEVHPSPDADIGGAKCDGPNSLVLSNLGPFVEDLIARYTAKI